MKSLFAGLALAALAIAAVFLKPKYDEVFVYPALRARVNDGLLDPDSSQYRNEFISKNGALCGEINSRNGMGGYSGFRRYMVTSGGDAYLEGHGRIGDSSNKDVLRILEIQNDFLRELLVVKTKFPDATLPTEFEKRDHAIKMFFAEKWKSICM